MLGSMDNSSQMFKKEELPSLRHVANLLLLLLQRLLLITFMTGSWVHLKAKSLPWLLFLTAILTAFLMISSTLSHVCVRMVNGKSLVVLLSTVSLAKKMNATAKELQEEKAAALN